MWLLLFDPFEGASLATWLETDPDDDPTRGGTFLGRERAITAVDEQSLFGVYLIRDVGSREIVYVGESHTGRLYETLTRHLYAWNGKGSGPSYSPSLVELAVIVAETPLDDPVADQYALIQEHEPRDNIMGSDAADGWRRD